MSYMWNLFLGWEWGESIALKQRIEKWLAGMEGGKWGDID